MDVNFWLGVVVFTVATVGSLTTFLRSLLKEMEERADRREEAIGRRFDTMALEVREFTDEVRKNYVHRDVFAEHVKRVDGDIGMIQKHLSPTNGAFKGIEHQ